MRSPRLLVTIAGNGLDEMDEEGAFITDDDLLLAINGNHEALTLTMPNVEHGAPPWTLLVDTHDMNASEEVPVDGSSRLEGRSLKLFARPAQGRRPGT